MSGWRFLGKAIRYGIAASCIGVVVLWRGAEPPVLDDKLVSMSSGIVKCKGGPSNKAPGGTYVIDGIEYTGGFGYVLGFTGTSCDTRLIDQMGIVQWIPIDGGKRRLLLEIKNATTDVTYGLKREMKLSFFKREIKNKTMFYLTKAGLMLLALWLIAGSSIQAGFKKLRIQQNDKSD